MTMQRPRLVATSFFPAFHPPRSGGEQRYYHLYERLSHRFDVTLVSASYSDRPEEYVEHSGSFREYRVPKPAEADTVHWRLGQGGIGPECSGYVVALCGGVDGAFGRRLRACIEVADVVVHESPFTVPYDHAIGHDGIPRVYNAYNVEAVLARQMLQGALGVEAADFIAELERFLLSRCDLAFATCEAERSQLSTLYGFDAARIAIVPNGYDEDAVAPAAQPRSRDSVVFLGSQHPPNVEAVEFIARQLAPAAPGLTFEILGGVCRAYGGPVPSNMRLHGFVSAERKSELLSGAVAAINPLFSGAGTNLKMLDYMAHGAPIVTTAVGARGLDLCNGEHALIAEPREFARALAGLASDQNLQAVIGNSARNLARACYSWRSIGDHAGQALAELLKRGRRGSGRGKVLWLCDYPVHRPEGGGQVRLNRLAREVGREFDVVLVCLADLAATQHLQLFPGVRQVAVPMSAGHRAALEASGQGEWVSIGDVVAARECLANELLVRAFEAEAATSDILVFEQCFLAPLLEIRPEGLPVVYSSQNCESALKAGLLAARRDGSGVAREVAALEHRLLQAAAITVCVSEADADQFAMTAPGTATCVIENGVDVADACAERQPLPVPGLLAVFVGSGHPPNVRAGRFVLDVLAPATPDVTYALVGSVCQALAGHGVPPNVLLLGFLPDAEKAELLAAADFAVNPMFEGGGSSLKVADYFAAGLATISSAVGMRGYAALDGVHYVAAEADGFIDAVAGLRSDPARRGSLGAAARQFASAHLDWRGLGGQYRRLLRAFVRKERARPRALVVTYRFGGTPRGGAEVFLLETTRRIVDNGRWDVDVAACDVGSIHDVDMFSAAYGAREPADDPPAWAGEVRYFELDPPEHGNPADCRMLHKRWMQESRELGSRFGRRLTGARLAGGWHGPEESEGQLSRWMSLEAYLRAPDDAERIELVFYAPHATVFELWDGPSKLHEQAVHGWCKVEAGCRRHGGLLTARVRDPYLCDGDSRELGVRVTSVRYLAPAGWEPVSMRHELDAIAEQVGMDEWVPALINVARSRPEQEDARFLRLRGPSSSALEHWLHGHACEYDIMLVQGVPFHTSVVAVRAARHAGVPVVVLPHVHVEDRYYHWRSFYDAFRAADRVIAAPKASVPLYFSRIGAHAVALPGGGVSLEEFSTDRLAASRAAFRRVHPPTAPFALVLGRKAGAKNYRVVLDACRKACVREMGIELVMIGPDEDGQPIDQAGVHYLGRQPRDVVIGALAEAVCLANMSHSESFGIVLLEAWLAGTPVVVSRACSAFTELVDDGRNGRLVDNADALAAAMCAYAADPRLAAEHATAGRAVSESHDWAELARQIEGLWDDVVSEASATALPAAMR